MPSHNGQRECTVCLSSTLACVHWDGQLLTLSSGKLMAEEDQHLLECRSDECPFPFHVDNGPDKRISCETCGVPNRVAIHRYTCHTTEAEARDEFRRREAAMREES